jgi:hypothetical protein
VGHHSSNGDTNFKRADRYLEDSVVVFVSENISYGYSEGLEVVVGLLADFDRPLGSNRKNMMDQSIIYMGVYSGDHSEHGTMSCIVYGKDRRW